HFHGGPKATMETVENLLNIPIDYYVRLNFEAFIDVVNSLDGINYNVPYEIVEMDSKDKEGAIHLYPGYQKLSGEEALTIVTTNNYRSYVERRTSQQEVITSLVNQVTSASSLFKLSELIDAVGSTINTNLSFNKMNSFFASGIHKHFDTEKVTLNGDGGY